MDALAEAVAISSNHRIQAAVVNAVLDSNAFSAKRQAERLFHAAEAASLGGVRALVARGAGFHVFRETPLGTGPVTALHAACFSTEIPMGQRCPIVEAMLESTEGRVVIDRGWGTFEKGFGAPIHCAAFNDNTGVLEQLVERGACVNPPRHLSVRHPHTPLMAAAAGGADGAVAFLLNQGADPNAVDSQGRNALHHLMDSDLELGAQGEKDSLLPCLTALLQAGTDPFAPDAEGLTPLALAQRNGWSQMAASLQALYLEQRIEATVGPKAAVRL